MTGVGQTLAEYGMEPATKDDVRRIEAALKDMTVAIQAMVLIQERQTVQGQRIGELETNLGRLQTAHSILERKVDSWINRGMGAWALVIAIATIWQLLIKVHNS